MRKIILTFLLTLTTFYSYSENWQDKWAEAALAVEKGQFENAVEPLNQAIALMDNDNNQPALYVDRTRLNLLLGLSDDASFSIELLKGNEKIRGCATQIIALGGQASDDDLLGKLKNFGALINKPTMELKDSKLIIRNGPKNEYYQKMMTCYLIHSGLCYDKDEFVWMKSGDLVAEKINHCGCQKCIAAYAQTRVCDACKATMSPTKENVSVDQLLVAGIKYCSQNVKQLENQVAFLTALVQIQERGQSIEVFDNTFDNIFQGIDTSAPVYWD